MNAQTFISHRMFVAALAEARPPAAAVSRQAEDVAERPAAQPSALPHERNPVSKVRPTLLPAESLLDRAAAF